MDVIKQVIVMRNDLNMRKGKMVAQGSHASMKFITDRLRQNGNFTEAEQFWMNGSFAKICVRCDSEEQLLAILQQAKDVGLEANLITDGGKTEFGGVPTNTCLAVGPDLASKIDPITGGLTLL